EPALELVDDGPNARAAVSEESVAGEASLLTLLLFTVDGADERASLGSEDGLGLLGVAELPAAVGVTAGLDDVARSVDGVEAMLGVGGELAAERAELGDDIVAGLVGGVLEDSACAIAIELDVAVVRGRQLRDE